MYQPKSDYRKTAAAIQLTDGREHLKRQYGGLGIVDIFGLSENFSDATMGTGFISRRGHFVEPEILRRQMHLPAAGRSFD